MIKARAVLRFQSALVLVLALSTPTAAKDVDEARAAYVAALAAAVKSDGPLTALSSALILAQDELSEIRAAEEQALSLALAGPQAALLEAEATARDLTAKGVPVSPRTTQAIIEADQLENERKAIASAAADRAATLADFEAQLTDALANQQDARVALATEQTDLTSAETAQQDISRLQELARTTAGLRDPKLREYVWSTNSPQSLVRATRQAFIKSAVGEIVGVGAGAQARYGEYSSLSTVWKVEDVPQGDAWLLWDSRTNGPLDLSQPRDDVFEQPVFLQIPVAGNTLIAAEDLQRVDIADVGGAPWPTVGGTAYDACLDRLAQESEDGAIRQICQTLFPADARFDLSVINAPDISGRAILLSGAQARAFAELYRQHLAGLLDLANGEVPALLLPAIQKEIRFRADTAARFVEDATKRLRVAETNAKTFSDKVTHLQKSKDAAVAANASAAIVDKQSVIEISARLTKLQEELAELRAEADRLAALHGARVAEAAEAVSAAQAEIDAARALVFEDWAARREQAEQAVGFAGEALARGQQESASMQSLTKLERERFLNELARGKIVRSVTFTPYGQICLRVQNNSKHYVTFRIGKLLFRGQAFPRMDLLDAISDGDWIFQGMKSGEVITFRNRYQEPVSGLPPAQEVEECSHLADPKAGELGRLFDSIGGFSQSGWDVELDVQFGTFRDTDKAIKLVSNEAIFVDELTAARTEASATYQKITVAAVPSAASSSGHDETTPLLAPANASGNGQTPSAPDLPVSGAPAERDLETGFGSAADEVLAFDRALGREVQAALNAAGFSVGQPDGVIGQRSVKAISDWQSKQGFAATGALTRGQATELLGRDLP
jgi:hypothetical protein